jgi:hypothetical protein
MLGKLRVALAPPLPERFHASLAVTTRGLTTRLLPIPAGAVEASLDLVDGVIRLSATAGRIETIDLVPARPIAGIWSQFREVLKDLGVKVDLWDKPQELADVTPFSLDERPRDYDPALGVSWLALTTEIHAMFEEWRSPFFGRSGVNFWWGGFDISVALYNGRHAIPRPGSNYLMRYDLDAEHLTIGFWPGDRGHDPMFFAYLVPEPANCAAYPCRQPHGHPRWKSGSSRTRRCAPVPIAAAFSGGSWTRPTARPAISPVGTWLPAPTWFPHPRLGPGQPRRRRVSLQAQRLAAPARTGEVVRRPPRKRYVVPSADALARLGGWVALPARTLGRISGRPGWVGPRPLPRSLGELWARWRRPS